MIVPAKRSLAVNAKSCLKNVVDFIIDLLIEGLDTECVKATKYRIQNTFYPYYMRCYVFLSIIVQA